MSLKIIDLAIATGSNKLTNADFKKDFGEEGQHFINDVLGKDIRYVCNEHENTLTLAAKAVDELQRKTNFKGEDIDGIIFSSQFPEYTLPAQSIFIHHHIQGKSNCFTLDINANCVGMLRGLDVANRYFNSKDNNYRKILLIGADKMQSHAQEDDISIYPNFADAASAVLLERVTIDSESYIIGSSEAVFSESSTAMIYPAGGYSSLDENSKREDSRVYASQPNMKEALRLFEQTTNDILLKHELVHTDIDWYCGSQFSKTMFSKVADLLHIEENKRVFVGNKYGYTGTSSPFLAMHDGIRDGRIKRGDIVLLTTIGVGDSVTSLVLKY